MVRPEVIRKRLNNLDQYLSILETLQKYSFNEFIENPERYGSCERFLHLSIESLVDMGNHVIAQMNLGVVNWFSDIPEIMATKGYIDLALKEEWIRMIGFRNTLVHEYIEIDRKIVYDVLQNKLDIFKQIRQAFAKFL